MINSDKMKILIIGNCGCGKTYLATQLTNKTGFPLINLDKIMWIPGTDTFRSETEIYEELDNIILRDNYIIEGVWGLVMEYLINNDDINLLIFLEINLEECKSNILNRISEEENGSISLEERMRIVKYAENYYIDPADSNFPIIYDNLTPLEHDLYNQFNLAFHTEIYDIFPNHKIHLKSKNLINKFISDFNEIYNLA